MMQPFEKEIHLIKRHMKWNKLITLLLLLCFFSLLQESEKRFKERIKAISDEIVDTADFLQDKDDPNDPICEETISYWQLARQLHYQSVE